MAAARWIRTVGIVSANQAGEGLAVTLPWRRSVQTARTMKEVRSPVTGRINVIKFKWDASHINAFGKVYVNITYIFVNDNQVKYITLVGMVNCAYLIVYETYCDIVISSPSVKVMINLVVVKFLSRFKTCTSLVMAILNKQKETEK